MKGWSRVIRVFATILIGLLTSGFVFAQEGKDIIGLTISPLTFELTANPGDNLSNRIKVYNPTENILSVKMEVEDFSAAGELGEVTVAPQEDRTYSLKRWVTTKPTEFTLKSKESEFVTFNINVPQNAEPGGKYGSILATVTARIGEGTGPGVTQKVGALVLLSVSGEVKEELEVEEFSAPSFSEYGPITFNIRFKNTGTVHVRPRGLLVINDIFGNKVTNIEIPQQNVIPGAIRKIQAQWDRFWIWGPRYQATLVGSYGSQNENISATTIFWVFPWKLWLVIFLILALIIYFVIRTRRKIKRAEEILKSQSKESQEIEKQHKDKSI